MCLDRKPQGDVQPLGCACVSEHGRGHVECSIVYAERVAAKMGPHSWFWCPLCKNVYTGVTRMALAQRWYALVCARTEEDDERLEAARNLAICLCDDGQYVEAEKMQREILPVRKRVHGIKHATTLQACKALAGCLFLQAKHAEAGNMYQEILEVRERVQGPEHAETLAAKEHLANSLSHQAKHAEAGDMYQDILAVRERVQGPEHAETLAAKKHLASSL